jgi:predicted transcriptional regulator
MNKFELDHFIQHPGQLNLESLSRLENLINEFPYCQVLQLLFVKNLHVLNHFRFSNQLKLAAAYSSDRKKLKQLIEDTLSIPKTVPFQPVGYSLKIETDNLIPKPEISPAKKDDRKTDLLELIKKRLSEIKEEKSKEKITQNKLKAQKSELINKFIDEQPTIARGKAEFFKPLDWARQSTQENEDIVTETLAKIYLKQGHNDKAIKIYEKLCLVFPDKSSYFADQIRKIQNL